jgi:hypothetical protein
MKIEYWMSGLKQDRKLHELCLPGSHDAGVYQDLQLGVDPGSKARCQYSGIWKQALAGSRVFDIRCFLRTKGVFKKTKMVTMGHFFKEGKDGYLGDYGGTLMAALEDATFFLSTHDDEFLIFRIGHTKCTGNLAEALDQFDKARPGVIFKGPSPAQNLAKLTVKDLRKKLLLVFDNQFNPQSFSASDGYFPYTKYPSIPNLGLAFCGKYSGGVGKSLAIGKENKGNWSPQGAVAMANQACQDHQAHSSDDHLLWIYWQETGGDVLKNTTGQQGMHNRLGQFLSDIRKPSNKLPLPNVIGHDFVNKNTCREIVKMNPDLRNTNVD